MAWVALAAAAVDAAANAYSSNKSAGAQDATNRYNVMLQREQQQWETMMSNTAVQRRADDIEAAGGNRALAFTNGQEATTPVIAPAHTEAPTYNYRTNFTGAALAQQQIKQSQAQIANTNANTVAQLAEARSKNVQANIDEASQDAKREYTVNHLVEGHDQDDLKTKIMRNLDATSGAEAKRQSATVDAMIQTANQQAAKGKLELDALENIAKIGGIEGNALAPILKTIISAFLAAKD